MTHKDLMVGDWVTLITPWGKNTVQADAELIYQTYQSELGQIGEDMPSYKKVEPIPISDEILQVSGFERRMVCYDDHFEWCDDYFSVELKEISDSIWRLTITHEEVVYDVDTCIVSYVHQLQHALGLFGVADCVQISCPNDKTTAK